MHAHSRGRRGTTPRRGLPRWSMTLVAAATLLLAGCTSPADEAEPPQNVDGPTGSPEGEAPASPSPTPTPAPSKPSPSPSRSQGDEMTIRGHILDAAFRPVADATVEMLTVDVQATTGPDGAFDLGTHPRGIYPLRASAPGHVAQNVTVKPGDDTDDLKIVLEAGMPTEPYEQPWHFQGILKCAFEALILSPSCDSLLGEADIDPLFDTNQSFPFHAQPGWRTIVLDVVFDGEGHPGLDGLRMALRGTLDADGGGAYQQYGRWHDAQSFTVRVEPGGNYTDGVEPVPADATGFQVDVYPHSHGYRPGGLGFLGVGAAVDVEFDVYVTVFYVEPAPEGYSVNDAA